MMWNSLSFLFEKKYIVKHPPQNMYCPVVGEMEVFETIMNNPVRCRDADYDLAGNVDQDKPCSASCPLTMIKDWDS